MTYKLKLAGVEKTFKDVITCRWAVDKIATWNTVLNEAEDFQGFIDASVLKDDLEILGGRLEKPVAVFNARGSSMPISGFDDTVRLRDHLTPSQSIVDSSTAAALAAILSETPFSIETDGVFEYINLLKIWDTHLEFLRDLDFTNTCIEINMDPDLNEIEDEYRTGTLQDIGITEGRSCFFYDGITKRFYVWTREGGTIYYYHSVDGVTWTRVSSGKACTSDEWSVAWYDSKVYLLWFDGANTDFSRGSINDGTGVITWNLNVGNIFAGAIGAGPYFDSQDDVWVIRNNVGGQAYESTDDGATWNNRFGPGANGLWGLAPDDTDGDMWGFEEDTVANDLEIWFWDRSAGTYNFGDKIGDEDNIDVFDVCVNDNYDIFIIWRDGNDVFYANDIDGWDVVSLGAHAGAGMLSLSVDGYGNAYIWISYNAGLQLIKYYEETEIEDENFTTFGPSTPVCSPRTFDQDGQIGIFYHVLDDNDDGQFVLPDPLGIRMNAGVASGYIVSDEITASGSMTNWGLCTAEGEELNETLWGIRDSATFIYEVQNQLANFDLKLAGVSPAVTGIFVQIDFDENTAIVYEFDISERIDEVTMDTDFEDTYEGVTTLADLAGAEFWVTEENGTFTVHFSLRRGEDKSNSIFLRAASSGEEDVKPNIISTKVVYDWSSFANAIKIIGGQDAEGNRVEAVVRDTESIIKMGQEYWITIRDFDLTTRGMARQRGAVELNGRNEVIKRTSGEVIDVYLAGEIEIGDSAMLQVEWDEDGLSINESYRIVDLKRSWGRRGEKVSAEFSNRMKAAEYWLYMRKTDTHDRWITA